MSLETQPSSQSFDIEHLQELLRPIREIAAVWDIPLKEYLDSYLDDLSNVDLSQDFDPSMLNFSQAGLFLQGTTNVYAKKVKNLYDLVINSSSSTADNNDNDPEQKKRKKKVIDFVIDDKLADIDDLAECDPTIKNTEDQSQLEITTMPKIPFCLLSSLDSSQSDGNSFRISEVPSQDYCVILLDKSIKFSETDTGYDLYSMENQSNLIMPPILGEDYTLANPDSFQSPNKNLDINENMESIQILEDIENKENTENNGNIEEEEENQNNDEIQKAALEDIPVPPELPDEGVKSSDEEPEYDPSSIKMLDPNATQLQFTSKPFKKMKKIRIPSTFLDSKRKTKKTTKKPFHDGIFIEIFEQGKKYREKRTKEEDKEALELLIPEEGGLDHVLKDIDVFVEPPLPQNDMAPLPDFDDEDAKNDYNDFGGPINSEIIIDSNDDADNPLYNDNDEMAYKAKCQELINRLIEMGKRQVHQTRTAEVLANWEKKVTPILDEERTHKEFFVPDVQEWVKDMLISHKGAIYFRELTSNAHNFEISRIFLAILMLGNAGEVILPSETPAKITNDFLIKLAVK